MRLSATEKTPIIQPCSRKMDKSDR